MWACAAVISLDLTPLFSTNALAKQFPLTRCLLPPSRACCCVRCALSNCSSCCTCSTRAAYLQQRARASSCSRRLCSPLHGCTQYVGCRQLQLLRVCRPALPLSGARVP